MNASELYAAEDAEIIAQDERLAAARAATQAAQQELTAARGYGILTSHGSDFGTAETRALAAATSAEGDALVERTRLHTRINAARAARKDPSR
jgi:hypothetical protein